MEQLIAFLEAEEEIANNQELLYPEQPLSMAEEEELSEPLDLKNLDLKVDVANIADVSNDEYIMLRRNGFGTSDSSVVLGVNPYQTVRDLIKSKQLDHVTDEERKVGEKTAVRKGRDLEPLVIEKWVHIFGKDCIKPPHQYRSTEHEFLTFNFDGVIKDFEEKGQYIPNEIKIVTATGQKHYNAYKAWFSEFTGFRPRTKQPDSSVMIDVLHDTPARVAGKRKTDIENKARYYGIPPYYFTQLQQQIYGLKAPFGFLTVLFETTWELHTFLVWRDEATINSLIIEGAKLWDLLQSSKNSPKLIDTSSKNTL